MALFSLLVAILVERLKLLPFSLQLDHLLQKYQSLLFVDAQLRKPLMMLIAMLFPTVVIATLVWVLSGLLWGLFSLILWVFVAIVCFSHLSQRQAFKRYVQAVCRQDLQACYHHATSLEPCANFDADNGADLGRKVGQSVAWTNYRFYGAVALFFILLGPVGAVFYCTVRYFTELNVYEQKNWPLVNKTLFLLDWIPSRIFAFGYALCGEFRGAFDVWRKLTFCSTTPAREIIVETALAAEPLARASDDSISLEPTMAMLSLSKRNFILMVALVSLLTIFGMVS